MPSAAAAGIAGVGALGQIVGGSMAASAQESAAQQAAATQMAMFEQTQANLEPYNTAGQNALTKVNALAGTFNYKPTMAETSQTPGYEFNLNQGLKATQNSAAARGLGVSGAAEKGAAAYATGLADTTYKNQFANALNSYQANLGGLQNLANTGESAAAGVGTAAQQTGAGVAASETGAGSAAAGGIMTGANALSGVSNTSNEFNMLNMLKRGMYESGSGIDAGNTFTGTGTYQNPDQ